MFLFFRVSPLRCRKFYPRAFFPYLLILVFCCCWHHKIVTKNTFFLLLLLNFFRFFFFCVSINGSKGFGGDRLSAFFAHEINNIFFNIFVRKMFWIFPILLFTNLNLPVLKWNISSNLNAKTIYIKSIIANNSDCFELFRFLKGCYMLFDIRL